MAHGLHTARSTHGCCIDDVYAAVAYIAQQNHGAWSTHGHGAGETWTAVHSSDNKTSTIAPSRARAALWETATAWESKPNSSKRAKACDVAMREFPGNSDQAFYNGRLVGSRH